MNVITEGETNNYLQSLVERVGGDLVSMYSAPEEVKHGLVFPKRRDGTVRVSEQEAKQLFIQHARSDEKCCYCVETPTRQTYCQKGTSPISARHDFTLVAQQQVNVEFKAGYCDTENIRKDLEKLIREGTTGVWFHTLETGRRMQSLFYTFREAFDRLPECVGTSKASYLISICLLDAGLVYWRWLNLTGDPALNLAAIDSVFGPSSLSSAEWKIVRFGNDHPSAEAAAIARSENPNAFFESEGEGVHQDLPFRGKGRREGFFIHAPTLAKDTYMHLSARGGSYRIRNFHLSGAAVSPTAFLVPGYPTLESLRTSDLIAKRFAVTNEDSHHNLAEEPGYWYQRIREVNQREVPEEQD
jgi:hypothetical protein